LRRPEAVGIAAIVSRRSSDRVADHGVDDGTADPTGAPFQPPVIYRPSRS